MTPSYRVVQFERWHLKQMQPADSSVGNTLATLFDDEVGLQLEQQNSWTLLSASGEVIATGGTLELWKGRHVAWFIPSSKAGRCMLRISGLVESLTGHLKGRIETTVRADFMAGHRWIKMLGFEVENAPGVLKGYGPEGEDHIAYVRFQ